MIGNDCLRPGLNTRELYEAVEWKRKCYDNSNHNFIPPPRNNQYIVHDWFNGGRPTLNDSMFYEDLSIVLFGINNKGCDT